MLETERHRATRFRFLCLYTFLVKDLTKGNAYCLGPRGHRKNVLFYFMCRRQYLEMELSGTTPEIYTSCYAGCAGLTFSVSAFLDNSVGLNDKPS